jgi:hypothetical protein
MALRVIWQYTDRSIYCHMTRSDINYLLYYTFYLTYNAGTVPEPNRKRGSPVLWFLLYFMLLYFIISYCIALVGIVFHCMILFCIVLYCIVLHCTSLFSIALFLNYIVLHCFVFNYCEFESRSWRVALYTTLCEIICQWLAIIGRWFSPVTPVSSTNKTDGNDTTELLLKVASNAKTLTP